MTENTRTKWARRVRRWRASGLTAREFSAREGLNAGTLRWWSSTLGPAAARPGAFVEVKLAEVSAVGAPAAIEVVLRDDLRIRVSPGFDPDVLRQVVAALEAR